jgi:hypothetical protein
MFKMFSSTSTIPQAEDHDPLSPHLEEVWNRGVAISRSDGATNVRRNAEPDIKMLSNMKNKGLRLLRVGFAIAAALLMMVVGASSASANATSTVGFGGCYVKESICLPRGTFTLRTLSVGGSGPDINYVSAGFTYFGSIGTKVWIDHDFYNADGARVYHLQGVNKYGNFSTASQGWTWGSGYYLAPRHGHHCATLYSAQPGGNIKRWATACHTIGG